jgi:Bacterial regulatory helix-turn-helix protein, lysR family
VIAGHRSQFTPTRHRAAESAQMRRISLTTLCLFISIYEEQTLNLAACRKGMRASAVSERMNEFDLAFGVTLFKRVAKAITDDGRRGRFCITRG